MGLKDADAAKAYRRKHYIENHEKYLKNSRKWYYANIEHARAYARQYQKDHPKEHNAATRREYVKNRAKHQNGWLRRRYGIDYVDFLLLLEKQVGKCAMSDCQTTEPGGRGWTIDHDHTTGAVRGVLCLRCNIKLGQYEHSISRAAVFEEYLKRGRK